MIYDNFSNLSAYKGFSKGLDKVIEWAKTHKVEELPLGRTEIDGSRVFVNVMEADTRPEAGAHYEVHHKYMDLQMDIEGCEDFEVPSSYCQDDKGFDEAADIGFGDGPVGDLGHLGGGKFALFLAGEPHMPTLSNGSCTHVKKAVFKILSNEYYDEV